MKRKYNHPITSQKLIKCAYEQQPKAVKKWLDEEYPVIEKRAVAEGVINYFGDSYIGYAGIHK